MNYQRREEILSKEALHIKDIMELYAMEYGSAAKLILQMKLKRKVQGRRLRLDVQGYIHILDYLEELGLEPNDPGERYCRRKTKSELQHDHNVLESARKSVCM